MDIPFTKMEKAVDQEFSFVPLKSEMLVRHSNGD